MEKAIYSPIELWQDFSLDGRLLRKNIVERKKENGFVFEKFFVDGIDSSRVFCKIVFPDNSKKNKKTLLLLNDGWNLLTDEEMVMLSDGSFAVATVDYAGKTQSSDDFYTKYPDELSYGNISLSLDKLNSGSTIHDSPWFLWARNIRIAMNAIFEVPGISKDGLLIGGIGRGSLLSMQIAAVDNRCNALLVISGYGYVPVNSSERYLSESSSSLTEENERWLSAFSMNANAKLIKVPTLITLNTNNPYTNVDNSAVLKSTFATDKVYTYISPYMTYSLSQSALSAITTFFTDSCSGKNKLVQISEPDCTVAGDKIVFSFAQEVSFKNCFIYYSHGKEQNKYRNWVSVKMKSKDNKTYTAEINAKDVSDELHFFVLCQTGSYSLTSVMVQKDIPHRNFEPGKKRIIYNSGMGKSCFFSENQAFESDANVKTEIGPFKIEGITGQNSISSFILSDESYTPKDGNILSMDVFGMESKTFTIALYTETSGQLVKYYYSASYTAQPKWDKINLTPASFKNDKNIYLKDWKNIKKLSFENIDGMLFNNILWI